MLGVKSPSGLSFYEWENLELVRRIEIQPKAVYWSVFRFLHMTALKFIWALLKCADSFPIAPKIKLRLGLTKRFRV